MTKKIGRNDKCHCGSGKKYKHCCLNYDESKARHEGMDGHIRFLTYSEIFGKRINISEIKNKLHEFNLEEVLIFLSKLNMLILNPDYEELSNLQILLRNDLFDENSRRKIAIKHKFKDVIIFEQQLLLTMNLAMEICDTDKSMTNQNQQDFIHDLSKLLLAVSDYCELETLEDPETAKDDYVKMAIRSYYFQHWENINYQFARYYYLFTEISKYQDIINSSVRFDIQTEFEEKTSISLDEYFTIGFSILANWYRKDLQSFRAIIPSQYFLETKIEYEKITKCLEFFTADIDKYKTEYKKDRMAWRMEDSYAFLTMKKYPLFQLEDGKIIPLDTRFLVDKISSNIYWTIMEHQKTNEDKNKSELSLDILYLASN